MLNDSNISMYLIIVTVGIFYALVDECCGWECLFDFTSKRANGYVAERH